MKPSVALGLSLCLVVAGFYIPDFWLRRKTLRRKNQIRSALPDALDLLVVCVEAGMGLDASMSRVGEEIRMSSPAISDEFRLFNLEVRAGKAKRDALKNLSLRTDDRGRQQPGNPIDPGGKIRHQRRPVPEGLFRRLQNQEDAESGRDSSKAPG